MKVRSMILLLFRFKHEVPDTFFVSFSQYKTTKRKSFVGSLKENEARKIAAPSTHSKNKVKKVLYSNKLEWISEQTYVKRGKIGFKQKDSKNHFA